MKRKILHQALQGSPYTYNIYEWYCKSNQITQDILLFNADTLNRLFNTPSECANFLFDNEVTKWSDYDLLKITYTEIKLYEYIDDIFPLDNIINWLLNDIQSNDKSMVYEYLEKTEFNSIYGYAIEKEYRNVEFGMWLYDCNVYLLLHKSINELYEMFMTQIKTYY